MENFLTNIKNNLSKASVNRKLYAFMVCVVIATFYWLLNTLGNTYHTVLKLNVTYINNPKESIILNELPNYLELHVTSVGYYVLPYKLGINTPNIVLDLSKYSNHKLRNSGQHESKIFFDRYTSSIASQIDDKIKITDITPKTFPVLLDDKVEKFVLVNPIVNLGFNYQYQLSKPISTIPISVKVTGPKSILDTLQSVPTMLLDLRNLESSTTVRVNFNQSYLDRLNLKTNIDFVDLNIMVDKFTEYKLVVPISTINLPDTFDISTFPDKLEVKFMIPLNKLSKVDESIFKAEVNVDELNVKNKKLKVHLTKYPSFIKSITINPAKVEYVLKRKEK